MFMDLLRQRRSIRRFQERIVEKEKIDLLVEAALRAPSSRGHNPWHFVVVSDLDLIRRLARAKAHGSAFLKDAPLAVVVCADEQQSDVWVEDAAIAAIFLHLAAADMGLGSCWIQIRKRMHDPQQSAEDYVARLLDLPPTLKVAAMIAIGYAAEEKRSHTRQSLQSEKVSFEHYGQNA